MADTVIEFPARQEFTKVAPSVPEAFFLRRPTSVNSPTGAISIAGPRTSGSKAYQVIEIDKLYPATEGTIAEVSKAIDLLAMRWAFSIGPGSASRIHLCKQIENCSTSSNYFLLFSLVARLGMALRRSSTPSNSHLSISTENCSQRPKLLQSGGFLGSFVRDHSLSFDQSLELVAETRGCES